MTLENLPARPDAVHAVERLEDALSGAFDRPALEALRDVVEARRSETFTVAVMGKAKRGKSTLLNALLGRRDDLVAPVDKLPASSAMSRFRHAESEAAVVSFRDGRREAIPLARIREFVTEEANPGNRKEVDVVEVEGPFPGLERGLVLVDTPGAGSIHEHHDQLLHRSIPEADAVIFLVTARMPLDRDELDLLRELRVAEVRKILFAINRVDECGEDDLQAAIEHNRRLLASIGVAVERLHPISARRAFRGEPGPSGLPELIREVSSLIAGQRARILDARFAARVRQLVEPVVRRLESEMAAARRTEDQRHADLDELHRQQGVLESGRELAELEFLHAWEAALAALEHGLEVEQGRVRAELVQRIGGTGVLDVRKLAAELPTWLNRTIEGHLQAVARTFEERAQAACARLEAECPDPAVEAGAGVVVRAPAGTDGIPGAVGGAALAAAGIGVAGAASGAAAGIAAANAAALAATTTVAAPSLLSAWLGALGLGELVPLATGTATVAAPAAMTATPMWVALGGPVGWTLAGIGALAVPFSWHLARVRLRDRLEAECLEQVDRVFLHIRKDRVPALRKMGRSIADASRLRLHRQLAGLEAAIEAASREPDAGTSDAGLEPRVALARDLLRQITAQA